MSVLGDKIRAQRESWLELDEPPRRALCIRRMPEGRMGVLVVRKKLPLEDVCECIVNWRGFTEADLLGTSVGSSDVVAFDADACRELVADDVELFLKVNDHLMNGIETFLTNKAAIAKN